MKLKIIKENFERSMREMNEEEVNEVATGRTMGPPDEFDPNEYYITRYFYFADTVRQLSKLIEMAREANKEGQKLRPSSVFQVASYAYNSIMNGSRLSDTQLGSELEKLIVGEDDPMRDLEMNDDTRRELEKFRK